MPELHRLSQLILGHRGKLKKLEIELKNPEFMIQLLSLRLAAILCHARRDPDLKGVSLKRVEGSNTGFVIHCKKLGYNNGRNRHICCVRNALLGKNRVGNWS